MFLDVRSGAVLCPPVLASLELPVPETPLPVLLASEVGLGRRLVWRRRRGGIAEPWDYHPENEIGT